MSPYVPFADYGALEDEIAALRAKVARVEALADDWEAKQARNRAHLLPGGFQHMPHVMLETFEPTSELRAALEEPT